MLPAKLQGLVDTARFKLRDRLARRITVKDRSGSYAFRCISHSEVARADTFFAKEPGTLEWIRREVMPGQVFYDVGANIGLYTLLAARHVGKAGMVYAFEPHLGNALSLLENIRANGVQDRVKVMSSPLSDTDGTFDFHYRSAITGSSGSQFRATKDQNEDDFTPAFSELKVGVRLDGLVAAGALRPPDHVKLDVDGNELPVLRGMRETLTDPLRRPKTLQVEVNARYKTELFQFMSECGFTETDRNFTASGEKQRTAGKNLDLIPYNGIFRPAI